jgi:hypothetical protein
MWTGVNRKKISEYFKLKGVMSTNRLLYDPCSYKQALKQSVSPVEYMLNPLKYEHTEKCRVESGLLGGTNVSHVHGNLVDLENNLRGQTYPTTHCSEYLYAPPKTNMLSGKEYIKPVQHPEIDTTMRHLRSCQIASQSPVQGACYPTNLASTNGM